MGFASVLVVWKRASATAAPPAPEGSVDAGDAGCGTDAATSADSTSPGSTGSPRRSSATARLHFRSFTVSRGEKPCFSITAISCRRDCRGQRPQRAPQRRDDYLRSKVQYICRRVHANLAQRSHETLARRKAFFRHPKFQLVAQEMRAHLKKQQGGRPKGAARNIRLLIGQA